MTRILVIDDHDILRTWMRIALELEGYTVEEACDGRQGIACHRAAPADLIITDILMPEKDGLEIIQELRREFPARKIIAISGGGQAGGLNFLPVARTFGVACTLWKPFTRSELYAAVQKTLQT
jgi:two-component system, chemotaxis family, chemotaxis protein CheY